MHLGVLSVSVGNKRPARRDMRKMPYMMAVIDETLRIVELLFTTIPYNCSEDIVVGGQTIPKDAIVVFSIDSVHYDPEIYPNPEVFDPTRFLDSNGGYVHSKKLIPFSMGKLYSLEDLSRSRCVRLPPMFVWFTFTFFCIV